MGTRQEVTVTRMAQSYKEPKVPGKTNVWFKVGLLITICIMIPFTYLFGQRLKSSLEDYLGVLNMVRNKDSKKGQSELEEFIFWDTVKGNNFTEFFETELVVKDINLLSDLVSNQNVTQYPQEILQDQPIIEKYLKSLHKLSEKKNELETLKREVSGDYEKYNQCIGEKQEKFKEISEQEKSVDEEQQKLKEQIEELKRDLSELRQQLLEKKKKLNLNLLKFDQNQLDLVSVTEKLEQCESAQKEYDGESVFCQKQQEQGEQKIDEIDENIRNLREQEIQDIYKLKQLIEQGVPISYTVEELQQEYAGKINIQQEQKLEIQGNLEHCNDKLSKLLFVAKQFNHYDQQNSKLKEENENIQNENLELETNIQYLDEEIMRKQEQLRELIKLVKVKTSDKMVKELNQELKECYNLRIQSQLSHSNFLESKRSYDQELNKIKAQKVNQIDKIIERIQKIWYVPPPQKEEVEEDQQQQQQEQQVLEEVEEKQEEQELVENIEQNLEQQEEIHRDL